MLCCREPVDTWTGKWFPVQPTESPAASMAEPGGMDGNSMWKMINATCDDGKVSLVLCSCIIHFVVCLKNTDYILQNLRGSYCNKYKGHVRS